MKAYLCSLTQTGLAATVPVLERILQDGHEIDWDHRPDPDRFSLREMLAHWADMDAE